MVEQDVIDAMSRIQPPLRVEAFNDIMAGDADFMAMIVREDDPGCSSILAQQMLDQTAHDMVDVLNWAKRAADRIEALEGALEALAPFAKAAELDDERCAMEELLPSDSESLRVWCEYARGLEIGDLRRARLVYEGG